MDENVKDALPSGYELNGNSIKYRVDEVLGQGTFGIVYRCRVLTDGGTDDVAIKEFFMKDINGRYDNGYLKGTELPLFKQYLKSFHNEMEHLSNIKHEGVVNVRDVFSANDTFYLVMEYLSGGSLNKRIQSEKKLSEADTLELAEQCCRALEHMHEHHMLHLDVKPLNIVMNQQGKPKLVDFGLSKVFDEDGKPETGSPLGMGTPGYAPLEQVVYNSTKEFSPTLDVYALGATLFHILTGLVPPTAINVLNSEGIIGRILEKSGVCPECTFMVQKAMAPVISHRTQTMKELETEIKAVQLLMTNGSYGKNGRNISEDFIDLHGFACTICPTLSRGLLYLLEEMLAYMEGHVIPGTVLHYHPYSMYYLSIICKDDDRTVMLKESDMGTLSEWFFAIKGFNEKTGLGLRLATVEEMKLLFSGEGVEHISFGHCLAYDAITAKHCIYDCRNKYVPELEISECGNYHAVVVCERKQTR